MQRFLKTAIVVTHTHGLMVGARTFAGNPYDGHILAAQLEQTNILLEDVGVKPKTAIVDLGFRGKSVEYHNPEIELIHRGKFKQLTQEQRRWLRRRQAVEPAIGHLKADHGTDRCWLKGQTGDAMFVGLAPFASIGINTLPFGKVRGVNSATGNRFSAGTALRKTPHTNQAWQAWSCGVPCATLAQFLQTSHGQCRWRISVFSHTRLSGQTRSQTRS